ncbi:hypothetical protein QZH41_012939, partial [Actinostola sp. cb2023]
MADEVGRVLVVSFTSNMSSLDAIKRIHGDGELAHPITTTVHLESYPWTIHNKYFTVAVYLCHGGSSDVTSLLTETSHLCFEGIIIIFDQEQRETLQGATDCMKVLESQNASVQLLVNSGKDDTTMTSTQGLSKTEVLEWCLKYSFELVELNPNDDDQQEADVNSQRNNNGTLRSKGNLVNRQAFQELQALNCGEWPNIELKGSRKGKIQDKNLNETTTDDAKSCAQLGPPNQANGQQSKTDEEKSTNRLMDCSGLTDDESELLCRLGQEDPDGESFEDLFTKLKDMK